jgi:hypothetical protein
MNNAMLSTGLIVAAVVCLGLAIFDIVPGSCPVPLTRSRSAGRRPAAM